MLLLEPFHSLTKMFYIEIRVTALLCGVSMKFILHRLFLIILQQLCLYIQIHDFCIYQNLHHVHHRHHLSHMHHHSLNSTLKLSLSLNKSSTKMFHTEGFHLQTQFMKLELTKHTCTQINSTMWKLLLKRFHFNDTIPLRNNSWNSWEFPG